MHLINKHRILLIKKGTIKDMEIRKYDNTIVVYLMDRLDSTIANNFQKEMEIIIEESAEYNLIFNMKEVTYISSSGIRVINLASKSLKSRGKLIGACEISEPVMAVFKVTDMDERIDCFKSEKEALEKVSQAAVLA